MPQTYEPIATTTLGSANSTITFSSIPATYTDLKCVLVTSASSGANSVVMRFNSDTGTNYSRTNLSGNGTAASSARNTNSASISFIAALSGTQPELFIVDIFSYAGSTNKTVLGEQVSDLNGSGFVGRIVGLWRNTGAINTIALINNGGNFGIGTTATLYGIKAA